MVCKKRQSKQLIGYSSLWYFASNRYQEILKNVFANREEIRKEYLKLEMQLKVNALKTHYEKQYHEQIQLMCSEERVEKVSCLHLCFCYTNIWLLLKYLCNLVLLYTIEMGRTGNHLENILNINTESVLVSRILFSFPYHTKNVDVLFTVNCENFFNLAMTNLYKAT